MIKDPEQNFLYKINSNDRYNEMQKEAMNSTIILSLWHQRENMAVLTQGDSMYSRHRVFSSSGVGLGDLAIAY